MSTRLTAMNFDLEALAREASVLLEDVPRGMRDSNMDGHEVAPGWFVIFNNVTGQSKRVLHHRESGYVFKTLYKWGEQIADSHSGRIIGNVTLEGDLTYRVRLPFFYYYGDVEVQEYVGGMTCGCGAGGWCEHAKDMVAATNCRDAHQGNWKIVDEEIVLFDFDGIRLDD